jgi:hypothetical protein
MDNSTAPKVWSKPTLQVCGNFEEITKATCKDLGSPSDGSFLKNIRNPLTACSS